MLNKTFCAAAWFNVRNDNDGTLKSCTCIKSDESYNIKTHTIEEWRNAPHMIELRKEHASGNKLESCQQCWDMENLGIKSQRQQYNEIVDLNWANIYFDFHKDFKSHVTVSSDLKIGNKCNLECIMCCPEYSSKLEKKWKEEPNEFRIFDSTKDYRNKSLVEFMDEVLKHPIRFINILGGEPLLEKRLMNRLLQIPNKHQISLNFITNGTVDLIKTNKLLKDFKDVHYGVSIDAYGTLNDTIRIGSNWEQVHNNLLSVPNSHIITTVQALNIKHLDLLIAFAKKHNKKMQFIQLKEPSYLSLDAIDVSNIKIPEIQSIIDDAKFDAELNKQFLKFIKKHYN